MKTDEQLANEIINARDGRDHPAGFVRAGRLAVLEEAQKYGCGKCEWTASGADFTCLTDDDDGTRCIYCWATAAAEARAGQLNLELHDMVVALLEAIGRPGARANSPREVMYEEVVPAVSRLAAAEAKHKRVVEALIRLTNEAYASTGAFEVAMREAIGNTNYACLVQRAEEARKILAALEGKP